MKKGDSYSEIFTITQEEVDKFAVISGDKNPIHIDKEYASKSIFGKPIVHGFLGGSKFSKVLGMNFPGEGTIYLNQEMRFLKPMFVNTEYTVELKVVEIIIEKSRLIIETRIFESHSLANIIIGQALVQNQNLKFEL